MNLRIITTFNEALYNVTGRRLLESINLYVPTAQVWCYPEGFKVDSQLCDKQIDLTTLDIRERMAQKYRHRIPTYQGGTWENAKGFNRRWWPWFQKIIAQHHALQTGDDGEKFRPASLNRLTVWLDSDVVARKPFTAGDLLKGFDKPIGVFRSRRIGVEAGVILFNERHLECRKVIDVLMNLFITGQFLEYERWDDGYMLARVMDGPLGGAFQDLARKVRPRHYLSISGFASGGHVLPWTYWGNFFDHEKGVHTSKHGFDLWSHVEAKKQGGD